MTATSGSRTLAYQYDAASNRTRMTWPDTGANALYVAYVYDALNHVTQIQENGATSGAGPLASYTYDSLGRRSGIARAGGSGASTSYAYDATSRLNTLVQTLSGSASMTYTLGYNTASQILTRQVSNSAYVARPGAIASAYTTNGLNQYSGVTGSTATYTAANAPVLTYDPAGALQTDTNAGATTNFLYDGANLVGEYDNSGNIISRYVTGPGIDEPVVWYQGAGTTTRNWLTADNQGSVIGYADQSGNSGATYAYGPYGEPITSSGTSAWGGSRYRYTGQIEISEAQLYYYKARVYDPAIGRFYQTDPAGLTSDVNLYDYTQNDPINEEDPQGLADCDNMESLQPDGSGGYTRVSDIIVCPAPGTFGLQPLAGGGSQSGGGDITRSPPLRRMDNSCQPANNLLQKIANGADAISNGATAVSAVAGLLGIVSSPTIVGGLTFEGISATAGLVSIGASAVGATANFFGGRPGNAGVDAFNAGFNAATLGAAKALPPVAQYLRGTISTIVTQGTSSICPS